MYEAHPCPTLNALFRAKPYQGAQPETAEFIFVGLDANFDVDLGPLICNRLKEYLEDGVAFWRHYKVHHPFRLSEYTSDQDGWRYHYNFSRLGFTPQDAHRVSFVELLHVPTTSTSELVAEDLDADHLDWLNSLMGSDTRRSVFLSADVIDLMRGTRRYSMRFHWVPPPIRNQVLPVLCKKQQATIYQHLHLSNYGRFEKRMRQEAQAIGALRRQIRVAIADSSPEVIGMLRAGLAELPDVKVVATVSNAEKAIELVRREQVDVLLLAFLMPNRSAFASVIGEGMTGLEALRVIRQHCPVTEVIVLSWFAPEVAEAVAMEAGAFPYFWKQTAQLDEIVEAVRGAARRRPPGEV